MSISKHTGLGDLNPAYNQHPQLMTIKNTASMIGVHYRQLLEAVNSGRIPHYKIEKSRKLLNPAEVISIMKNNGGNHD